VQAAQPRRFGFGTGLAAGLFGAGLLGLFMGNGFLGGLSGLASMFGLLLQLALVAVAVMFLVRWFRRRQETPAYARASTNQPNRRSVMDAPQPQGSPAPSGLGSMLGGGLGQGLGGGLGGMGRGAPAGNPVHVGDADYAAFDKALQDVQSAYSRQDIAAIWDLATPEMAGYIQEELSDNTTRGVVNTVSDVRLESGDLAEAWSEGTREYATVAMRYSMIDVTKDKATGQVVDGDPAARTEATELWTFVRERGSPWKLSAIQQAQ
jgi:predicted lipid-binding transport protein (Tim44 family)